MTNTTNGVSCRYEYWSACDWWEWAKAKAITMRIDNSRYRTENYLGQFSVDMTSVLFRVQTLKLNTLAINLAFMRLSRGIEGSDGCDSKSIGMSREKRERVKIVYMHLYPSFRGEGCPVAMVTRWLIGRTTDAGRRWRVGRKILRRILCSLIYYSARRAWATVIRAMTLAMFYNLEKTTSQREGSRVLSLPFFPRFYNHEDM